MKYGSHYHCIYCIWICWVYWGFKYGLHQVLCNFLHPLMMTEIVFYSVRTSSSWRKWCRVFWMVRESAGSIWKKYAACWKTSSSVSLFWVSWTEPSSPRKMPDRRSYAMWWDAFLCHPCCELMRQKLHINKKTGLPYIDLFETDHHNINITCHIFIFYFLWCARLRVEYNTISSRTYIPLSVWLS